MYVRVCLLCFFESTERRQQQKQRQTSSEQATNFRFPTNPPPPASAMGLCGVNHYMQTHTHRRRRQRWRPRRRQRQGKARRGSRRRRSFIHTCCCICVGVSALIGVWSVRRCACVVVRSQTKVSWGICFSTSPTAPTKRRRRRRAGLSTWELEWSVWCMVCGEWRVASGTRTVCLSICLVTLLEGFPLKGGKGGNQASPASTCNRKVLLISTKKQCMCASASVPNY